MELVWSRTYFANRESKEASKMKKISLLLLVCLVGLVFAAGAYAADYESTLDKVLDTGKLTVACFSDVPPIGYYNERNELVGTDVEVAKKMAEALGVTIEFVSTTNANRIPYLLTNKVDVVIASFTMNSDRRKVIEYSDPYFRGGAILVVNTNNPASANITSIDDLQGKNIAVSKGSFNDELATALAGDKVKSILRLENVSDLYAALNTGKVEAVVEDVLLAGYITKNQYPNLKVAGDLLSDDIQGIGVRRGDQIWLNWINGFVFDLLVSGEMKAICEAYGITYTPVHFVY
ncbi:MAG TPA: amino acid ABC transporter substrate-binding protein [Firmicutes bacterium]|nr:amino acid ABC transporter substrate-binding protein [Bacillota bacterium]